MQRALPGAIRVVPAHDAAEVRAYRGNNVRLTVDLALCAQVPRRSGHHAVTLARLGGRGDDRRHPALGQVESHLEVRHQRGGEAGGFVWAPTRERAAPVHPAAEHLR